MAAHGWCEHATLDLSYTRCYVRGDATSASGSTGAQGTLLPTAMSGHDFRNGRAIIWSRDNDLETRSELAVSIDDPVELRRVVFTNLCERYLTLSATSYAEIVVCPSATAAASSMARNPMRSPRCARKALSARARSGELSAKLTRPPTRRRRAAQLDEVFDDG